jgi:hypothetical protein
MGHESGCGGAMGPLAMLDVYPPALLARFGREAGVGEPQLAKARQDFYDTLVKIGQQRARAAEARIEIARVLGEAKVDAAAIGKRVDEQAKAEAEAAKLWLGLLQRIRDALTPEQRAKLDELRQEKAAWAAAAALPWLCGGPDAGPPGPPPQGRAMPWGRRGDPSDREPDGPPFGPEGWEGDWDDDLGSGEGPPPCRASGCRLRGPRGSCHHGGGHAQPSPPWF